MAKKNAFRPHIRKLASGDASDILLYPESGNVERNRRYHITLLAFEDETTACTETQVSAGPSGVQRRICEQSAPVAGKTYWFTEEIILTESDRLEVYFSGAQASDVLNLWLQGYWVEVTEDA